MDSYIGDNDNDNDNENENILFDRYFTQKIYAE